MAFPTGGQFLLDNYREKPAPLARRSDMESGPAKQAPIGVRRSVQRPCAYHYSAAEYSAFKTWFAAEGRGWFDWVEPHTGATISVRLLNLQYESEPLVSGPGAALEWIVSFTLEAFE